MASVSRISVTFGNGDFREWVEANGDTYPQEVVDGWQENFNRVITERLSRAFPGADVEVKEGYNQTLYPRIEIDPDDVNGVDELVDTISSLLDIGGDGKLMDEVFTTPQATV